MYPTEVRPGVAIATVTGNLVAKDNKLRLESLTVAQLKRLSDWTPGKQVRRLPHA